VSDTDEGVSDTPRSRVGGRRRRATPEVIVPPGEVTLEPLDSFEPFELLETLPVPSG